MHRTKVIGTVPQGDYLPVFLDLAVLLVPPMEIPEVGDALLDDLAVGVQY